MDDKRWPWLIVLPKDSQATELHHLDRVQATAYWQDISDISRATQAYTQCQSVNIAMLGNVVSALHCHIVARNAGDPNWPNPIWGFGTAVSYEQQLPDLLIQTIRKMLKNR